MRTFKVAHIMGHRLLIGRCFAESKGQQWNKAVIDRPGAIFTFRGAGEIIYGDSHLELQNGDMAVYDALPRHSFRSFGDWEYFYFHFPESMIEKWKSRPSRDIPGVRYVHFEKSDHVRIMAELKEAAILTVLRKDGWDDMVEALLQLVLTRFFNRIPESDEKQKDQLQPAVYLLTEFRSTKNMADLAKSCGMSRTDFFRKFRSAYGCTPMEYRNNAQISQAKILLCSTNFRIREIAEQLHFQDCYYFTKFFRNCTGFTPSAWRRANIK